WLVPSITTGWATGGKGLFNAIVNGPLPEILKSIVLGPGVALESSIAWRRSVWPSMGVSVGLFTTIVASRSRGSIASMIGLRVRAPWRWATRDLPVATPFISHPLRPCGRDVWKED